MTPPPPFSIQPHPSAGIRWLQVCFLLGLDLVILLSWMAYNEYQPRLVDQFGYGSSAHLFLGLQILILVVTPPLAGYLTDRLLARGVARLVVVTVGISLAAMVFMATALTVAQPGRGAPFALFPVLVVLWMISMNIFHAPAISLLELCAPPHSLTGVAALFTVLAGLAGALEPSLTVLIDRLGAPATFAVGGVMVLAVGLGFLRSSGDLEARPEVPGGGVPETSAFGGIVAMGLALGVGEALMNDLLPVWIARKGDLLPGLLPAWQSSALYGLAALAAWPLGWVGDRVGSGRLALGGGLAALALGLAAWVLPAGSARPALGLFPIVYAALAVASLPVAFRCLTPNHKVFGVGLLFSGIELAAGGAKLASSL